MAVKSTFPNAKQPITDGSGYVTKAHFDFLRTLWRRTGGNTDSVADAEDEATFSDITLSSKIRELEKRIIDLENELSSLGC